MGTSVIGAGIADYVSSVNKLAVPLEIQTDYRGALPKAQSDLLAAGHNHKLWPPTIAIMDMQI